MQQPPPGIARPAPAASWLTQNRYASGSTTSTPSYQPRTTMPVPALPRPATISAPQSSNSTAADKKRKYELLADGLIPESALFNKLVVLERRMDETLQRNRREIDDAAKAIITRIPRFFRLVVSHKLTRSESVPDVIEARLKVEGYVINPSVPGVTVVRSRIPRFSHFFSKIGFDIPENASLPAVHDEWRHDTAAHPVDGISLQCRIAADAVVRITLHLDPQPARLKLSTPLSALLRMTTETRPRVITALWQYVKSHQLQDASDPAHIICDGAMTEVFGMERMHMTQLLQMVDSHLAPLDPIVVQHSIRARGPTDTEYFDIQVDIDDPQLGDSANQFLIALNSDLQREIASYEQKIHEAVKKTDEHRKRRDFMLACAADPAGFLNELIASQTRDLKLIKGEPMRISDSDLRPDQFYAPSTEEAVSRYLNGIPLTALPENNLAPSPYMQLYRLGLAGR
eukprot:TRINITY_DN8102_c0_g1_i1.p1 TRINITY_DN8102_c0_g1~~TRINITY_DN8102_c0_g1_i1.p1  ORF type:complete len:457 (-),score=71.07 TRINITY_DN8102_c0_g1_i1:80-1450(-)